MGDDSPFLILDVQHLNSPIDFYYKVWYIIPIKRKGMEVMKKIDKRTAHKLYDQGIPVKIVPCYANPEHPNWRGYFEKLELIRSFDDVCESTLDFWKNMGYGKRLAYYIEG